MSRPARALTGFLSIALAFAASADVRAGSITYTQTLPLTPTDFGPSTTNVSTIDPLSFQQFDTHGGALALDSVSVKLNAALQNNFGMTFTTPNTTRRWANTEQHKIWISGHNGVVLSRVTVLGSAAAGVFVDGGASNFRIDNVTVRDTRADGIHITDGSNNGSVDSPIVSNTGDDGVAVVSYDKDRAPCTAIRVTSPQVLGTTLSDDTRKAISRAASGSQALTLLLTAPEFLRR